MRDQMKKSDGILRIGLKYCGGCNPDYDRTAVAREIADKLEKDVKFVSPDCPGAAFILAVEGCGTACADLSDYDGKLVRIIKSEKDTGSLISKLECELAVNKGGRSKQLKKGEWRVVP